MSPHSDTSRFRANQSLLFVLNAACLAEKQKIPIYEVFGLTRSTGLKASMQTITPQMWLHSDLHQNHNLDLL